MVRLILISIFCIGLSSIATSQNRDVYQLLLQENGASIDLKWRSLDGSSVLYYELYSMNELEEWILLETVTHDPEIITWRYSDEEPREGVNTYLLKAIDISGAPHFSDVEEIFFEPMEFEVLVYPNPANNWVVVNSERKQIEFRAELVNKYGVTLAHANSRNGSVLIDTSDVIEGHYYIKINGGSVNYSKSIVINHR